MLEKTEGAIKNGQSRETQDEDKTKTKKQNKTKKHNTED